MHEWVYARVYLCVCVCVCVCVCGFVWFFLRQLSRQRELMVFSQCVYQFSLFLKQKHSLCHDHMSLNILFYYRIPQYHQWTQLCYFSSVQLLSRVRLCDPMDCSTPGFPVHHQLLELIQTQVYQVVMPSNHLILCCPVLLSPSIFPSIRVFSNESVLHSR